MIDYRKGDLLTSGAASLVNPVNCVGVSGAGLAKAFKAWAPDAVGAYERQAKRGLTAAGLHSRMRPGDVWPFLTLAPVARGKYERAPLIYFVATKEHWRNPSYLGRVADGLNDLAARAIANVGTHGSIAIPALGCGLGGLRWSDVRPLIHAAAERMAAAGVRVWIYEPGAER